MPWLIPIEFQKVADGTQRVIGGTTTTRIGPWKRDNWKHSSYQMTAQCTLQAGQVLGANLLHPVTMMMMEVSLDVKHKPKAFHFCFRAQLLSQAGHTDDLGRWHSSGHHQSHYMGVLFKSCGKWPKSWRGPRRWRRPKRWRWPTRWKWPRSLDRVTKSTQILQIYPRMDDLWIFTKVTDHSLKCNINIVPSGWITQHLWGTLLATTTTWTIAITGVLFSSYLLEFHKDLHMHKMYAKGFWDFHSAPMQLMPQQSPQVICATGESTDTYLMILGTVKTIAGPKFARSSNRVENMRSLTPVSQMSWAPQAIWPAKTWSPEKSGVCRYFFEVLWCTSGYF